MNSDTVIERLGERSYQGERYVGRVDVPVEELCNGNCSLVLRNLTLSDTGVYVSRQGIKIETFSLASYVLRSQVYLSVF
ncbi:antigen like protein, partial [Clarias magur]